VINRLGFEAALLRQPEITFAMHGCSFLTITITCYDWRQPPPFILPLWLAPVSLFEVITMGHIVISPASFFLASQFHFVRVHVRENRNA